MTTGLTGEIRNGSPVRTLHLTRAVYARVTGFVPKRPQIAIIEGRTQPGANLQRLRANVENLELITEDELCPEDRLIKEGWGWPTGADSAHYFLSGVSLCINFDQPPDLLLEEIGEKSPDDCSDCTKRLSGLLRIRQTDALDQLRIADAERLESLIRVYDHHSPTRARLRRRKGGGH